MSKSRFLAHRLVACFLSMIGIFVVSVPSTQAQQAAPPVASLPPLRVPNLAIGTRCFGFLPCTGIDPFGLRLRFGALAVFRPEKGHDREFYAARIQLMPAITLMKWAEIGVAIPITLYKKEIGVSTVPEPIEPYGRLRIPLEDFLGGISTTAYVRVRIASGPFVGGLPPQPASDTTAPAAMSDFMAQAAQVYKRQTEFEVGLALSKRIGPVTATGALGTSVAPEHVEIYGGGELAYRAFQIVQIFVQGQGIGIPKCRPDEAALNFCSRAFRFGAGVRFDWDLGSGGILIGTASGGAEVGWMVGGQFGLDYDETTRRRHGDGVEAAQAWWDRRFAAMARGWAEWKSAAAFWPEEEAARRARPPRRGPFSSLFGPAGPPPSSPWLDGLLGDDVLYDSPLFPDTPSGAQPPPQGDRPNPAATGSRPSAMVPPKPGHGRRPPRRNLFHEAMAHARQQQQFHREPGLLLPSGAGLMNNDDWDRLLWQMEKDRLAEEERQRRANAPTPLPDWGLVALNTAWMAPYAFTLSMLAGASPEGAAKVAEAKRKLRLFAYSAAEDEYGTAMEDGLMTLFSMGGGSAIAADMALARVAMMRAAERGAITASQRAAVQAAERAILGVAEEGGVELGGSRAQQFLANARTRLNPMNYRVCGVNCGAGGIEFKPPTPAAAATTTAEVAKVAETEAVHVVPVPRPSPVLGRGSTANLEKGSTLPRNLREQLAVEQAMAEPKAGEAITKIELKDSRWPQAEGWVKMRQKVPTSEGELEIHYVRNQNTGAIDDFKIKIKPETGK